VTRAQAPPPVSAPEVPRGEHPRCGSALLCPNIVATAWANGLLGGAGAQAFKVTPSVDAMAE